MSVEFINVAALHPHPKNPRLSVNQEVVDQIAAQLNGAMDEAHALIVRPNSGGYEILSGHHRVLAAKQAGLEAVPCWVREMSDLTLPDPFGEIADALILANSACNVHSFTLLERNTAITVAIAFDGETFTGEVVDPKENNVNWLNGWLKVSILADALCFWDIPVCPDIFSWTLKPGAIFFHANGGLSLHSINPLSQLPESLPDDKDDIVFREYVGEDTVYFVRAKELGLIKIGFSSNAPKRLVALKTSSPDELELLNIIRGGQQIEKGLHQKFAAQRVRGEWFKPTDEMMDFIRKGELNG